MPEPVLSLIKYVVLALLYLFFLRVLRAVWVELREPKVVVEPPPGSLSPAAGPPVTIGVAQPGPEADPTLSSGSRVPPGEPLTVATPVATPPAEGGQPAFGRLVVTVPDSRAGQTFAVDGEVTLGRAPGCGIALSEDTFVSHLHARVFTRDGVTLIEDLGSTNGTFVNEVKVTGPALLHPGDRVQIGRTVLEYRP